MEKIIYDPSERLKETYLGKEGTEKDDLLDALNVIMVFSLIPMTLEIAVGLYLFLKGNIPLGVLVLSSGISSIIVFCICLKHL